MVKNNYLAMRSGGASTELITSDLQDLGAAAKKLATHTFKLALGLSLGTTLLEWIASIAAIYLLVLDRTNWRTNILTALLVPYIFFSLPSLVFSLLRGEIGKWIAFVAVVLRLFFPRRFPDWLEMPSSVILLIVVAPSLIADTLRGGLVGFAICLIIGCYLLQEHIRASGGFRNSFTKSNGISNSVGILILVVYPVCAILFYFL
ncbi:Cold-regulated 413 plasma membrane protein [Actinidia chinensis var. chinensis]|uniref:Cold-regulated 413 plasma membrane protein n=1 Tax=Actinidia chinensis var. chinensis TaxID=1590841 RepID=A0A2R6RBX4_ACTCC|nr:Cold-regulated 413 plasma membrane protein [Actinidia chinensis var. chinensis]